MSGNEMMIVENQIEVRSKTSFEILTELSRSLLGCKDLNSAIGLLERAITELKNVPTSGAKNTIHNGLARSLINDPEGSNLINEDELNDRISFLTSLHKFTHAIDSKRPDEIAKGIANHINLIHINKFRDSSDTSVLEDLFFSILEIIMSSLSEEAVVEIRGKLKNDDLLRSVGHQKFSRILILCQLGETEILDFISKYLSDIFLRDFQSSDEVKPPAMNVFLKGVKVESFLGQPNLQVCILPRRFPYDLNDSNNVLLLLQSLPIENVESLEEIVIYLPDGAYLSETNSSFTFTHDNLEVRNSAGDVAIKYPPVFIEIVDHHNPSRAKIPATSSVIYHLTAKKNELNSLTLFVLESPGALDHDNLVGILLKLFKMKFSTDFANSKIKLLLEEIVVLLGWQDIFCGGCHPDMTSETLKLLSLVRKTFMPKIHRLTLENTSELKTGDLIKLIEEDLNHLVCSLKLAVSFLDSLEHAFPDKLSAEMAAWINSSDGDEQRPVDNPAYNLPANSVLPMLLKKGFLDPRSIDQFPKLVEYYNSKYPNCREKSPYLFARMVLLKNRITQDLQTNERPIGYKIITISSLKIAVWNGPDMEPEEMKIWATHDGCQAVISIKPLESENDHSIYLGNLTVQELVGMTSVDQQKDWQALLKILNTIISCSKGELPQPQLKGDDMVAGLRERRAPAALTTQIHEILQELSSIFHGKERIDMSFLVDYLKTKINSQLSQNILLACLLNGQWAPDSFLAYLARNSS